MFYNIGNIAWFSDFVCTNVVPFLVLLYVSITNNANVYLYSVSIGGTTGLFLGASMLSFVEILYFFVFRGMKTLLTVEEEAEENLKKRNWMQKLMKILKNSAFVKVFTGNKDLEERKYKIPKSITGGLKRVNNMERLMTRRILVKVRNGTQ